MECDCQLYTGGGWPGPSKRLQMAMARSFLSLQFSDLFLSFHFIDQILLGNVSFLAWLELFPIVVWSHQDSCVGLLKGLMCGSTQRASSTVEAGLK